MEGCRGVDDTYCAEAGEAFLIDIRFDGVDAFDDDVEPDVEFLVVD
jgi:hypothetical protein